MMFNIQTIQTKEKCYEIYLFLSRLFYEQSQVNHEHYYPMSDRYQELFHKFSIDQDLLYYIENEDQEIIAALTSKNMNIQESSIILGMLGVRDEYRHQGLGSALVDRFEKDCIKKGISHLSLGARKEACAFYQKQHYHPELMVQVFDFATIEDIKKANHFSLKVLNEWQDETMGGIFFKVDDVNLEYLDWFESQVPTASCQFVFVKDL